MSTLSLRARLGHCSARSIVVAFGLVGASTIATAQTVELPEIVVSAGQSPMEASRVGASVTVISGEELRQKHIPTVAEALRSVPGVEVDQSGGRGTLTQVRIRGDEANHVLILIDGIEVNAVADANFDFADLTVDDVDRIEVIRGPQSGIYGSNAQSGVIAIITRTGKGLKQPAADVKVEAGSMETISGSANVRGAAGPFYGSATVSDYTTSGYPISRFGGPNDGSRALTLTGKAGVDLTENFNIEGVVRHTDRFVRIDPQDFGFVCNPPGSFNCVPSPTFGLVIPGDAGNSYDSTAGRLGATLTLFDGHWVQSADAKIFDEHLSGFQNSPPPAFTFDTHGERRTLDYKSIFKFATDLFGGENHTATILLENRREHFVSTNTPIPYDKGRKSLAGEYVLDLPTDTTLSGALRQDWNTSFADVLTWRLALSQRFAATGTRIHTSAGKGVTDPNVFELFGFPGFNLPNPSLKPEQTIGWDAGVEQKFLDGRIVTDVTYFSTDFTDKIELGSIEVPCVPPNPNPAIKCFKPIFVNGRGTAIRRGVELANTFRFLDWLALKATYTYTNAKDSKGNEEIRRPPHSASLDVTAYFDERRLRATIGVHYNSVRTDFFFQPFTPPLIVDLPATTVVRASLAYDLTRELTAFIRAENLFNLHYEEIFSYRAPPFAVYAGLKLRLGQ
jgi:vitamin B12 transporter